MKIYCALIINRHGGLPFYSKSEDGLEPQIYEYCLRHWDSYPQLRISTIPDKPDEAIRHYFKWNDRETLQYLPPILPDDIL